MATNPSPLLVLPPGGVGVCPHAGQMPTLIAGADVHKVHTSGQAVATSTLPLGIVGCSFAPGGAAHPCTFVGGVQLSTRVTINGKPALLAAQPLLCQAADQVPQGVPLVLSTATRVVAT